MRTLLRLFAPAAILAAALFINSTASFGKPEYTKKEKKPCAYCHLTSTSKDLNETGMYYRDHGHSFEGYQPKSN